MSSLLPKTLDTMLNGVATDRTVRCKTSVPGHWQEPRSSQYRQSRWQTGLLNQ